MGQISDDTKREILASTDIVELIGRHVKLRRAGSDWKGLCPFHNEKSPSFSVSQSRGRFHCFGCGESGDAISFIQKYENLTFPEALKILADRAGIKVVEAVHDPEAAARSALRSSLKQIHRAAAGWFHELLLKDRSTGATAARNYLKGRGIDSEVAKRWNLGFAPSGRALASWAADAGFALPLMAEAGLLGKGDGGPNDYYPRFRDRLMFPIEDDATKEVIAFSGRNILPDASGGKYYNSQESLIFKKSKIFFGLSKTKQDILKAKSAIVCEGQLDLITCVEFGIGNVVAPLGTAFTDQHAKVLKRYAENDVILCFDADNAGYSAAEKAFRILSAADVSIRVATMPPGQDPDSLIRTQGPDAFRALIDNAADFFDYQINYLSKNTDLTTTRGRVAFSRTMAESAAGLESRMTQDAVIHKVAARLHLSEKGFREEVESAAKRAKFSSPGNSPNPHPQSASGASNTVLMLCRYALTINGIAPFLRKKRDARFLDDIPGSGLLTKIWLADFDAENPEAVSLFIDGLPPDESGLAGALILSDGPTPGTADAEMLLTRLEKDRVQVLIRQAQTQIEAPDLHPETMLELQCELLALRKEFLDLEQRLKDISQLYPNSGTG